MFRKENGCGNLMLFYTDVPVVYVNVKKTVKIDNIENVIKWIHIQINIYR